MTEPQPYTPTALPAEPVGVFGCTVQQVGALARTIEIVDAPSGDRDPDPTITIAEVTGWIEQLSNTLAARLPDLARVRADSPSRATLLAAGADAVANGAASYAEGASHPEFASPADATSYAALLWERWQQGADDLAAAVKALIDAAGPDVEPDPRSSPAAWCFPPPALPDNTRW